MSAEQLRERISVVNEQGLHLRPMSQIMEVLQGFDAEVVLEREGLSANCAHITEMMMLISPQGTEFEAIASGPEARAALDAIVELFAGGFGE